MPHPMEPRQPTLDYAPPRPEPAPDGGRAMLGCMFAAMILVGLACVFFALLLSGGGHGWGAAFPVSLLAALTSPLSVVAWGLRRRAIGKCLALLLVILALIANLVLVSLTRSEGVDYFTHAWSSMAGGILLWGCLWAVWQIMSLSALLVPGLRQAPDGISSDTHSSASRTVSGSPDASATKAAGVPFNRPWAP